MGKLVTPTKALENRGLPARVAPLDTLLAELEFSECDAFYNPRLFWSVREISGARGFLFTGRAYRAHYLSRSWRGGAGTDLRDTGVITWN